MADLIFVPNVGYVLDPQYMNTISSAYGSLPQLFNAQITLYPTGPIQQQSAPAVQQGQMISYNPSASAPLNTPGGYYTGYIPATQQQLAQIPFAQPLAPATQWPAFPAPVAPVPMIGTAAIPANIVAAFTGVNPSATTVQQAMVISDVIQSYVASAMSKTQASGNTQAQSLAQQAYQKAFATVNATNSGQYALAYQSGLEAVTLAQQALSLVGG